MVFELLRPSHPFYEHLCPLESRVIHEVEEILAEWGVAYSDFNAMLQTWKFRRRYGGVPTLVISASREREEIDDSWVSCARKIQEYLVTVLPPLQDQDQDEDEDQHLTQPLPHVIRVEIADRSVSIGDAIHVLNHLTRYSPSGGRSSRQSRKESIQTTSWQLGAIGSERATMDLNVRRLLQLA
jgi:hypothetical protein